MWRRCEVNQQFFQYAYEAYRGQSAPPHLESFVAATSGGQPPSPGDVVHQAPITEADTSGGVILLMCDIPPGTPSFDTLAFYNTLGELMAWCSHPSADGNPAYPGGGSLKTRRTFAYLDLPRG